MSKRIVVFTVPAVSLLVAAAPAMGASSTTIRLKVSGAKGGFAIAIASQGSAVKAPLKAGRATLKVPRSRVAGTTIQLSDAAGRYLGPLVLDAKGSKAYLTLGRGAAKKGSLDLGTAKLSKGYAKLSKHVPAGVLLTSSYAKAVRGAPIGAGRLGLQKAAKSARAAQGASGTIPGGTDPDRDGLPSSIDIDDNGNGILDNQDASQVPTSDGIFASMNLRPSDSGVNVNATGVTDEQIDANLSGDNRFSVTFFIGLPPERTDVTGAWVDCGALPYCNDQTGTAVIGGLSESSADLPRGAPWRSYRPDGNPQGNGLEKISRSGGSGSSWAMGLSPRATSAQISPGDIFNTNFRGPGGATVTTIALPSYPVTAPAVKSLTTGATTTDIAYGSPSAPGTNDGTAIQLAPAGDLSMTYWRPQRRGVSGAGEPAFMDMGRLHYSITIGGLRVPSGGPGGLVGVQAQREFSCDGAGNAVFPEGPNGADFFGPADPADDSVPDAANTRTYATNLRTCVQQALPVAFPSLGSIPAGAVVNAAFTAAGEQRSGGADRAVLSLAFRF